MTDAYVIQSNHETAGIVVVEESGLRFFASEARYFAIDRRLFANIRDARAAVERLQSDALDENADIRVA